VSRQAPHEAEQQASREPGHQRDRDARRGRSHRPQLRRRAEQLRERELWQAFTRLQRKAQRIVDRIHIEGVAARAVAEQPVRDGPGGEHAAVRQQPREARPAGGRIAKVGVSYEVTGDADGGLSRCQRQCKEQRRQRGVRAPGGRDRQHEDRSEPEQCGQQRIAVGDPGRDQGMRVVDGEHERGEPSCRAALALAWHVEPARTAARRRARGRRKRSSSPGAGPSSLHPRRDGPPRARATTAGGRTPA